MLTDAIRLFWHEISIRFQHRLEAYYENFS